MKFAFFEKFFISISIYYWYIYMDNSKEWWLNFTQLDLVNGIIDLEPWLPDLESKLKSIQRFFA